MSLLDLLLGKALASDQAGAECIGTAAGIPIFGLDALSSAAYGPEAALTLLIPLGAAGIAYMVPISLSIIILLAIVYFSYRQTIAAYPGGGGSYTVARQNLGANAGLLAAAALMIDYVLTVAVGISAGVGALVSAVPSLQPHTLAICLGILVLITLINLRGMRDTGVVFMAPTYLFVGTLLAAIVIGLFKTFIAGGHPVPVEPPPLISQAAALPGAWIILQAFASGCTAMTGVEAVSNGVKAFREPVVATARRTLTIIIALLMALLAGIAYLVRVYGIAATDPGRPGYQSVLSLLLAAVAGKGVFYYTAMAAILIVLAFSANTAFADFPRHCTEQLPPTFFRHTGAQARVHARHSRSCSGRRFAAHHFWRHYRSPDSPLRRGSISRLHPFPGWHGRPLAPCWRQRRNAKHGDQWFGSACYWYHSDCGSRCEICRRRVDHGAPYSCVTHRYGSGAPPLSCRFPGSSLPDATRDG